MFVPIGYSVIRGQSSGSRESTSKMIVRLSVRVGDLVKYTRRHKDLQDLTGLVVGTSPDRFYHGLVRVLWSNDPDAVWDHISQMRVVNESR